MNAKIFSRLILTAFIGLFSVNLALASPQTPLITAGWIERATLFPANVSLKAKMDTGAKTSSINAADIEFLNREQQSWVRFSLVNSEGESVNIEQPVVRNVIIKRHFGRKQERPVIRLDFCVGNIRKTAEVTLVDRSGLNYQFLIGRNFMADNILVNPGKTFLLESATCPD